MPCHSWDGRKCASGSTCPYQHVPGKDTREERRGGRDRSRSPSADASSVDSKESVAKRGKTSGAAGTPVRGFVASKNRYGSN